MEKLPKITVIIPVKDRVKYLYHILKTCLTQEYPNFEVIVADDASTDDTTEMIREFTIKDNRIRLIAREKRVDMLVIMGASKYLGLELYWKVFKASVVHYLHSKKTVGKF
ncbi:MAG: glycosyltransferase family 2 protein [Bacteroidales bacterium]|nr:glycosyltransferase family 2 protein [Bacteroidales bacterium]